jgi:alpha-galactosidase
MKHMVDAIRTHGLRPGLWLAPVAADKHSKIATEYVPLPSTSRSSDFL